MNAEKQRGCPACRKTKSAELGVKNNFLMLDCKSCGSIYSSHPPADDEAENYDVYYTEENLQAPDFVKKRLEETIESFSPYFFSGRLLDIGFGSAILMQVAREKGWQATGAEISKSAIEHAEKLGFEVFHGELAEAKYPNDYFDVITASEIIEHCLDPEILLNEVFRILRPGGLFWATTPSAKGLSYQLIGLDWTIIYPPEHLQLFSKKGVRIMLQKAGFSRSSIDTTGFNPVEVAAVYRNRFHKNENIKTGGYERVKTGFALNEKLTKNRSRQKIKSLLNGTLNFLGVGDSLKIKAVK